MIVLEPALRDDAPELADIRAVAMRPSLETLGRYDENRVRSRFLDSFVPQETWKILLDNILIGFAVVREKPDHLYLDHLYVLPEHQGRGVGKHVLDLVKDEATAKRLPIRLGALRNSRSNDFYRDNGFMKMQEEELDVYYEWSDDWT